MRVRLLELTATAEGAKRAGEVVEVTDLFADRLIESGRAVEVKRGRPRNADIERTSTR